MSLVGMLKKEVALLALSLSAQVADEQGCEVPRGGRNRPTIHSAGGS